MRFCVNIRVYAQRYRRRPALCGRDLRNALKLGLGFDVETENAVVDRQGNLAIGLADARESHPLAGNARGAGAAQFTFRDHIHAGTSLASKVSTA